jgi:hypothetical protein
MSELRDFAVRDIRVDLARQAARQRATKYFCSQRTLNLRGELTNNSGQQRGRSEYRDPTGSPLPNGLHPHE